jgi:RNA polymerase sigma factor (sigma-70 family)
VWNDRRLVRRAARGDSDAFATIFRRYQQDLYRYCVAILGDSQDAQDALQNTMVKALRALPGEHRQVELKPWLYRIAHNESIELRRRTRPTVPLDEEAIAPGGGPEQTAADRGRLRDLLADIGELPGRHRGALLMRELGGLGFEQIAAALDTSPAAARQVVYEARRSLRQMSDGREMKCDAVTALLSDQDGRVARRRDVRAHLRGCPECRSFAEDIRSRSETLAGIAPLGAIAAAGIAKGAMAGTASGGAAAAAGGGATTAGGAAGLAGSAAKVASTAAILKSAAAVVAVVGVSAVAIDHGHLFAGGGSDRPAVSHDAAGEGAAHPRAVAASESRAGGVPRRMRFHMHPHGGTEVGLKRPDADPTVARAVPAADGRPVADATGADASRPVEAESGSHPRHPAHPIHPEHPAHPVRPSHPARPTHPIHPAHPSHPVQQTHPVHPAHPEESTGPPSSAAPAEPGSEAARAPAQSEHPERPTPPGTAEAGSVPTEATATSEGASPPAESTEAASVAAESDHGKGSPGHQ